MIESHTTFSMQQSDWLTDSQYMLSQHNQEAPDPFSHEGLRSRLQHATCLFVPIETMNKTIYLDIVEHKQMLKDVPVPVVNIPVIRACKLCSRVHRDTFRAVNSMTYFAYG